jgi:transcriptional regulator with XRE-family HTH domain
VSGTRGFDLRPAFEAAVTAAGIGSDRELARRMGLAPSTVSRVRSGEIGAGIQFVRGLALAFPNTPVAELVDLT